MKTIILSLMLIIMQGAYGAMIEGDWTSSLGDSAPSCMLYRKRVAGYYQRVSEVAKAERALKGNFSTEEISKMVELWQRTGVPLLMSTTATFVTAFPVGEIAKMLVNNPDNVAVDVRSQLFNWESDTFIFPNEVFSVAVDEESELMTVEMTMQYAQACLRTTNVVMVLSPKVGNTKPLKFEFDLNKTKWDLSGH